jgi:hypothetical protein
MVFYVFLELILTGLCLGIYLALASTELIIALWFFTGNMAAQRLGVSSHLVSRVTGTIYIVSGDRNASVESCNRVNVGLNLKFNKRNEEVCCFLSHGLMT